MEITRIGPADWERFRDVRLASLLDSPGAFGSRHADWLHAPAERWQSRLTQVPLTLLAHVSRLTRSSMIEALDSAYVKVARARGLPERVVITRHALRNALLPTITVLARTSAS